ncbi:MAG: type II secretion system minor pseudopilin GspI [Pseudomonadota bacterium]
MTTRTDGFTLMEVLAALAVFSIASVGLMHAATENARTARIIETRALAAIVADNKMTETLTQQAPLVAGFTSDTTRLAERGWQVNQTISRTQTQGVLQIEIEAIETIDGAEEGGIRIQRVAFRSQRR